MVIKHKLIQDFQFTSSDKKIFVLKTGTILQEYKYRVKNETVDIDRDIVDANPEFFEVLDYKSELLSYLKLQKVPQPSQVHKKLIPFIEDMVLSSIQQSSAPTMDDSMVKELERRDKRIKDKEEEIEIRLNRVEKREESYKEDLKSLDKKEDDIRLRSKELTEKQLDIDEKLQVVREKERNIDRISLESTKDIDSKYSDLQRKIERDLRELSEKEKDIDVSMRDLKKKEAKLEQRESEIDDKIRDLELKSEEVSKLRQEMKSYQCQHGGCFIMLNGNKL